ncbi:bifunctional (p)ppGpp synthetase/guanosine-3',5'-bis(diphosphate) 3'-pyrophosphohydrolase [Mycoplasmatota bacterium]|nr:bifunctional (p)ppGpp synthetase/guanosine-3',5'-bis(diphosphate) 3'-pyrophosphohydrolase [Mycoplasmatota bacterium]
MPEITLKFEQLMQTAKTYITNEANLDLIEKAYNYAEEKHHNQFRKSGEPYIIHPLEVATILTTFNAGPNTIAAGLLHDVLEDTGVTYYEMTQEFGEEITTLVDGVSKLGQFKFVSKEQALAQNYQKMFLAMAKDIRVIIIKLADRLHNMRTLKYMPKEKQTSISKETLEIFVPIAHRLGMYRLKSELEDRCLRYIDVDEYYYIAGLINEKQKEREQGIANMIEELSLLLDEHDVKYEIKGRIKNIYSVHKKMREKNKEFSEIFDLLALRLIVSDEATCYHVLGVIHANFKPIPKRFKDYIAMPKPNMYQSLHTTVIGPNGKIFEVQIRTKEMDNVAEFGVAAHWAYKENRNNTAEQEHIEIQKKLKWYKEMVEYTENDEADDIVELMKDDIFSANVYVFTPNGDVLDFPAGATPLDFAYRIHSEIGDKTVGAIVNGKIVPLTYELVTGDVVEIKTSKQSYGPSEGWLKIVKTQHAKGKIRQFFNKQNRSSIIEQGKDLVNKALEGKVPSVMDFLSDEKYISKFQKQGVNSVDDLLYAVGKKIISIQTIIQKAQNNNPTFDAQAILEHFNEDKAKDKIRVYRSSDTGIVVDGLDNPHVKISKCCSPIPGDSIVGYVTKGKGITVHKSDCKNVTDSEKERVIDVYWSDKLEGKKFEVDLMITAFNRNNLLTDVINSINALSVNLVAVSANINKDSTATVKIKVLVEDVTRLNNIGINLKKIKDIYFVERITK